MDSFLWGKGCLIISELWNSTVGRRQLKTLPWEKEVFGFTQIRKKDTTKSKSKPPSVSGTDVAQFPHALNGLGGNAENQVNGYFAPLDLTASLDPWPSGLAVTVLSCLPSLDAHLSFFLLCLLCPFFPSSWIWYPKVPCASAHGRGVELGDL